MTPEQTAQAAFNRSDTGQAILRFAANWAHLSPAGQGLDEPSASLTLRAKLTDQPRIDASIVLALSGPAADDWTVNLWAHGQKVTQAWLFAVDGPDHLKALDRIDCTDVGVLLVNALDTNMKAGIIYSGQWVTARVHNMTGWDDGRDIDGRQIDEVRLPEEVGVQELLFPTLTHLTRWIEAHPDADIMRATGLTHSDNDGITLTIGDDSMPNWNKVTFFGPGLDPTFPRWLDVDAKIGRRAPVNEAP